MIRPDLHLSPSFLTWLAPYLAVFSRRTRPNVAALTVGALLAVGPRTVTNCLRALGLAEHPGFTAFHRVLNRNAWSGLALARTGSRHRTWRDRRRDCFSLPDAVAQGYRVSGGGYEPGAVRRV